MVFFEGPCRCGISFDENLPLRDAAPVINTVEGAMEIQQVLEWREWAVMSGDPVAFAPYLRKSPREGLPAKSVVIQFARGDQTIPNPTKTVLKDPHSFLVRTHLPLQHPNFAIARGAQEQMAVFFATDGAEVIDPDDMGPLFEVPIAGPLPQDLGCIP